LYLPKRELSGVLQSLIHLPLRGQHRLGFLKNAPFSQFHPSLQIANQAPNNSEIISLIAKNKCTIYLNIFVNCCNTSQNLCYLLTLLIFLNYSGRMDDDLKALELKVTQLISLCNALRTENEQLRVNLNLIEADTAQLKSNMAKASERIESLLGSLP